MANDKNKANDNLKAPSKPEYDFADFLPAGFDKEGLQDTGGLTPMYSTKEAFEQSWAPVGGMIDRIVRLPPVLKGKEWFVPHAALIRDIVKPTKGLHGTKDNREVVDIAVGGEILIPITGNLETNKELIRALNDTESVHFGIFMVAGQQKVNNQITPMWVWKVQIHDRKTPRKGEYAAPFSELARLVALPTGQFYDIETGEVFERGQIGKGAPQLTA
jgi:hypothetical protein